MPSITKSLFNGRMLMLLGLGISSGLPLLLTGSTLKYWMKEAQVDLTVIGIFALVGLPYTLKFVWAPLMDRYTLPFLGRRRGWIALTQVGVALGLCGLAGSNPLAAPWATAAAAFVVAFLAASQDIAIDAYRREILTDEEQGLGASLGVNGYRIGMLIAGGGALALADQLSWQHVYFCMAGIMVIMVGITLLSPEPEASAKAPRTLTEAVVQPFVEYFRRPGAIEILIFILLYKIGDSMASDMFSPFYVDMGFEKLQIAAIAKGFGFAATILGGLLGGIVMLRLGVFRSLWIFGILQAVSTFGFSVQALYGNSLALLTGVIAFENLSSGMGTAAYAGYMAALCDRRYTATQYALLSSLMGVPRVFLGSSSGYLAKHMGWSTYFLFCTVIAIPGLLFLFRVKRWEKAPANV